METRLRAVVLGAAAGGGLPQWNCGCANCNAARDGRLPVLTQSSLAVSGDGASWAILNASPDIGRQILATPQLHPTGPRTSPIKAVLLTNGDIDHVAGLLTLREKQPFRLFMTGEISAVIRANPIFAALDPAHVERVSVALDQPFEMAPGLTATLFAVPGKVPLYMEGDAGAAGEGLDTAMEGEQTVAVEIEANGARMIYAPGCAVVTDRLKTRIDGADALFFDGTLFADDEMIRLGLGQKTGRRMGHVSMNGPDGSVAALSDVNVRRRVYVHMNNSNPALDPDSPERRTVEDAGWEIASDGMEVSA